MKNFVFNFQLSWYGIFQHCLDLIDQMVLLGRVWCYIAKEVDEAVHNQLKTICSLRIRHCISGLWWFSPNFFLSKYLIVKVFYQNSLSLDSDNSWQTCVFIFDKTQQQILKNNQKPFLDKCLPFRSI